MDLAVVELGMPLLVNLIGALAVTRWEERTGGCVTDIWVQDLPRAVGASAVDDLGICCSGSGALIMMPEVSVVCADSPGACFWTTRPNLDQTVAVASDSGWMELPPSAAATGHNGPWDGTRNNTGNNPNSLCRSDIIADVVVVVLRSSRSSRFVRHIV